MDDNTFVFCFVGPRVALVGGDNPREGRVDVTYQGVVGTICDGSWSAYDARVICKQQGFGEGSPDLNVSNSKFVLLKTPTACCGPLIDITKKRLMLQIPLSILQLNCILYHVYN